MGLHLLRRSPKLTGSDAAPLLLTAARAAPAEHLPLSQPQLPADAEWQLYDALRASVPVVDAAIRKIVRLTGGFRYLCADPAGQAVLDRFCSEVPVNASAGGIQLFADQMLDSLLTYGNAAGELLCNDAGAPCGLMTVHPRLLRVTAASPTALAYDLRCEDGSLRRLAHPERILFAALDPPAGSVTGVSVLRGLPAVAQILLRIFGCIAQNYERAGNIRYAVTYRPDGQSAAFAKEHAEQIAQAWKDGMIAAKYGEVQDFVTAGDVDIKVIGADNQLFDTNVPVRQLLEQIVSKLSIPPFLLGFSWATTERMSKQQADILTSELDYFRRILSPALRKIGTAVLHAAGICAETELRWETVNLQDETELAEARLKNAQATEIELRCKQAQQN